MNKVQNILIVILLFCFVGFSQGQNRGYSFMVKGSVKGKENLEPISGVIVTTSSGGYTVTNGLGEFKIEAIVGDDIRFESNEFISVSHRIASDEDVDVLVEDYTASGKKKSKFSSNSWQLHTEQYLDSAIHYRKINIEKSIDFVTKAISQLGRNGDKTDLAKSYTVLGETYQYYKQYDLAIDSYKNALVSSKNTKAELLLAECYILEKEYASAVVILKTSLNSKNISTEQKAHVYESLGDAYKGLGQSEKSLENYNIGLRYANSKSRLSKQADLNSKIADVYVESDEIAVAEEYYDNSLLLSEQEAPKRAVQEKEKVADFYNRQNEYDKEVDLRKKSLEDLERINESKSEVLKVAKEPSSPDSISTQRIKYKIGNALLSQQKYDEAIPYLEESIVEAGEDDDLIVQKDATRRLSELYEYKGDFSKAYETYRKYVTMVDTLYIRKEQEIARASKLNRDIAVKQNRISGLEKDRELYQSKYDLALTSEQLMKGQRWLIYSLIFGMLLFGLTTYFFYRSNKQQKLANNLLALKSLRSQMNPHFIFNALNSVNNYIAKSDERSANRYLSDFSTLMRAVLENSEEDFISLVKEIELLTLYTKLEHSRFPDKFEYEIKIDANIDVSSYQIPPMLLQPYIENAIWHGLRYKEEKGFLKINIEAHSKNEIQIIIVDNGVGRSKSIALKTNNQKKQKSKGMKNIKKRIDILNDMYKDKLAVDISDYKSDGTGTKVVFTLKKDE
ncbi:histidine kinase [Cellulophaga baltica]|uniref:tetratricopeptide repeat-containing sensor histidine kinase n=1 Tax=Cellulophaga TaxID=104264 RepID=UPI001C06C2B7|nr:MULTISPECIES: histidine kinase [Cellulophaga]MBU2995185.1 histidine kinase [Cellulophaga baltica]MDO6766580.1 histidine kinase [Cellulophaga sp. 1_MG-2023]